MVPLTVNGLIHARSMVMLDSARRNAQVPPLVRRLRVRRPARELPALLAAIRCRRRLQRRWRVRWRPGGCPSVRVIRVRLHIGQSHAQRVRAFLSALINA